MQERDRMRQLFLQHLSLSIALQRFFSPVRLTVCVPRERQNAR
jgi:hypothetical protein